jgi:hypothetical protein
MSIKIDRVIRFWSTFFKSLVLMVASKKCTLPIPAPPTSAGILDRSWKLRSLFLAQAIRYWKTKYAVLMVHP